MVKIVWKQGNSEKQSCCPFSRKHVLFL